MIRKAEQRDLADLLRLAISVFKTTFEAANNPDDFKAYMDEAFTERKMESEFREVGSQFFVAFEKDKLVAYARLRENPEVNDLLGSKNLELQRLYVDIPWQGKGIANQLMNDCEDFAKQIGKEWIWLGVWEHNPKAQRFYKKLGYEKFSEHRFMVGNDPQTDWLMRKRLDSGENGVL
jgi:diamine N-acetyltransferase